MGANSKIEWCGCLLDEPMITEKIKALPPEIPRDLLGQIVDEVFGGAIEDVTVIEDIYRVIARNAASFTGNLLGEK